MTSALAYEDKGADTSTALLASLAPLAPLAPLALIHGHPSTARGGPRRSRRSPPRRVIAPDLRGYGASSRTPAVTGFGQFAADIAALLDELKVESFVLAGLSMGGQIKFLARVDATSAARG